MKEDGLLTGRLWAHQCISLYLHSTCYFSGDYSGRLRGLQIIRGGTVEVVGSCCSTLTLLDRHRPLWRVVWGISHIDCGLEPDQLIIGVAEKKDGISKFTVSRFAAANSALYSYRNSGRAVSYPLSYVNVSALNPLWCVEPNPLIQLAHCQDVSN